MEHFHHTQHDYPPLLDLSSLTIFYSFYSGIFGGTWTDEEDNAIYMNDLHTLDVSRCPRVNAAALCAFASAFHRREKFLEVVHPRVGPCAPLLRRDTTPPGVRSYEAPGVAVAASDVRAVKVPSTLP